MQLPVASTPPHALMAECGRWKAVENNAGDLKKRIVKGVWG